MNKVQYCSFWEKCKQTHYCSGLALSIFFRKLQYNKGFESLPQLRFSYPYIFILNAVDLRFFKL